MRNPLKKARQRVRTMAKLGLAYQLAMLDLGALGERWRGRYNLRRHHTP